jgi:hypothetical protein
MSDKTEMTLPAGFESGLFVSGVVVSSSARAFHRKDGTIAVSVRNEIAYEGGVLAIESFVDPREDARVKVDQLNVVEFLKLETFKPVRFRIEKWKVFNNQLIATKAERLA